MTILNSYRRYLPHIQIAANPHFLTFCTLQRYILAPIARDIVLGCCLYEHDRRANLRAAVIMPDHVHLVLTPYEVFLLPKILGELKSAASHKINKALNRTGPLWQEESFDHRIRSDEGVNAKIAYVLQYPVRAGLVRNARDYE